MSRLTAVTLAGVTLAATWTVTASSSPGCIASNETRNTWHEVAVPAPGAQLAQDGSDACTLFAAAGDGRTWSSTDGGVRWRHAGDVGTDVRDLVRAGLPNDVLVALPDGPGLQVSRDAGRSWSAASGLSGVTLSALAVDPDDRTSLWATGTHSTAVSNAAVGGPAPTGSVFSSNDAGRSWTESAGGVALHPGVIARLGAPYSAVFAADPRTKQLWRRSDQDTFTPVYSDDVQGLAVSPRKGGGSQLYAAGPAGVAVTNDGGTTFRVLTSAPATAVAAEYQHFTAFMYVSGGAVRRSTNGGRTSRPADGGLRRGCEPVWLRSDQENPATFLARCTDGSTWRWRSDGADLSDTDTLGDGTVAPIALLPQATPMELLAKYRLPSGAGNSAAIAFDGTYLYYTRSGESGRVHRVIAATGRSAPDVVFHGVDLPLLALTYDSLRHVLYLVDTQARTWAVQLRGLRTHRLFTGPYPPSCDGCPLPSGSITFDASLDQFAYVADQENIIHWFSRSTGTEVHNCTASSIQVSNESDGTSGFASVVASGDGDLYVGVEDDSTIYRIDGGCHVTASFTHAYLDEAADENDAMACDTVTFSRPAIWMRDAGAGVVYAYATPGGYCALATNLSVTAPARVSTGTGGPVCARLTRAGTGAPISGQAVQLFVANRLVGNGRTDGSGRTCAAYQPTPAEAGRSAGASRTVTTRSRLPVVGAFLGTIAYRPASARARLLAIDPAGPVTSSPPRPPFVAAAPVIAAAPPGAVAPPPPPAPPAAQVQPLPQAHPGAQPGAQAMGQPGAAAQHEDEVQAATAQVNRDEFRARPAPERPIDLRVVLPVGLMLAVAVARRRRSSRVRAQSP